jgi:hypothetical protein
LKRAELTYAGLADRLNKHGMEETDGAIGAKLARRLEAHGLKETEAPITNKLARGTLTATFLLATLAALGMEAMRLEDL